MEFDKKSFNVYTLGMDNPIGEQTQDREGKDIISVMIVDDHPLMHDAIRLHLQNERDIKIIADAFDGEEAVKLAAELKPALIIMDITMPKLNGLEATQKIKAQNPEIEILVLTVHDDSEHILKILEAGAAGYLTKTILGEKLVRAVRSVIDGDSILAEKIMDKLLKHAIRYPAEDRNPDLEQRLSIRELEIFRLAARGLKNKQIAQELNLNLRTIKGYMAAVYSKLNASSRTEAVIMGLRNGLLTMDDISPSNRL